MATKPDATMRPTLCSASSHQSQQGSNDIVAKTRRYHPTTYPALLTPSNDRYIQGENDINGMTADFHRMMCPAMPLSSSYQSPTDQHPTATAMTARSNTLSPCWTAATSLMDMPNEILCQIILTAGEDFPKTWWSLSLSCKHLHAIVEEHCGPEYNLRGRLIEDPFAAMEQIRARSSLRNVIRVVRMRNDYAEHVKHTQEEVDELITSRDLAHLGAIVEAKWGPLLTDEDNNPFWLAFISPRVGMLEVSNTTTEGPSPDSLLNLLLHDAGTSNHLRSHGFRGLRKLTLLFPQWFTVPLSLQKFAGISDSVLRFPKLKMVVLRNIMLCRHADYSSEERGLSHITDLDIQSGRKNFMYPHCDGDWKAVSDLT